MIFQYAGSSVSRRSLFTGEDSNTIAGNIFYHHPYVLYIGKPAPRLDYRPQDRSKGHFFPARDRFNQGENKQPINNMPGGKGRRAIHTFQNLETIDERCTKRIYDPELCKSLPTDIGFSIDPSLGNVLPYLITVPNTDTVDLLEDSHANAFLVAEENEPTKNLTLLHVSVRDSTSGVFITLEDSVSGNGGWDYGEVEVTLSLPVPNASVYSLGLSEMFCPIFGCNSSGLTGEKVTAFRLFICTSLFFSFPLSFFLPSHTPYIFLSIFIIVIIVIIIISARAHILVHL